MSGRKLTAALTALVITGTALMSASMPAQGAVCVRDDKLYVARNYATTQDVNGACGTVGVQHGFSVSGISSTIWTGWTYHSTLAATSAQATIQGSHHKDNA